ncbi:MAG: hypothetical protein AAGA56_26405 [Myxococcota bacterium]
MNYAAVNAKLRGFAEAEKGYRPALQLRPRDYETHLGLSLALREQIRRPEDTDRALRWLAKTKALAPQRPETSFNEAVLLPQHKARGTRGADPRVLRRAQASFRASVERASREGGHGDGLVRACPHRRDQPSTRLCAGEATP